MSFAYAVALTGSIATGKSTVAKIFEGFGFTVIDADSIAHRLLDLHVSDVVRLFGDDVLSSTGVNRKALGEIVFAHPEKRKALESLLHPLIYTEIEKQACAEDQKAKPYLVDIPLFFETNRYAIDKSLVVYTPKALQLQRLMARNAYSEEEARSRISTQIDIEIKKEKATYVIDNSKDIEHLQEECAKMRKVIVGDFQ